MSHLASIDRKRLSRGRRALGLFAAVWLNLALAPCAMAYEADDDHDCPHCPPAAVQDHHGMHGDKQAGAPCADNLADCGLDGEFSHDARGGNAKLKQAQPDLPVMATAIEPATTHAAVAQQRAPPPADAVGAGAAPPLHLLYCVFLD